MLDARTHQIGGGAQMTVVALIASVNLERVPPN
jgi:hypothetical protein